MPTLLTVANNVFRDTGFPDATTVVGNGNRAVRSFLAQAQVEGRSMARRRWSILTKRHIFTTASSAETYKLPDDFYSFVTDTNWNTSAQDPMFGPISDESWQANKSGVVTTDINDRFQVRADGNKLRYYIDPVPTSAEQISFFYITDRWCTSSGGQRQNEWKADADLLLLDQHVYELGVKWRFLRSQRRDFSTELQEYQMELNKAIAQDGGMPTVVIAPVDADGTPPFVANVGETGFG